MSTKKTLSILAGCSIAFAGVIGVIALATPQTALGAGFGKGRRGRRGPPAKALAACRAKSKGDACSFNTRRRSVKGSCDYARRGNQLVCKDPNRMKRRRARRRKAIRACQAKTAGDACSFATPRKTVNGHCKAGRRNNTLMCRGQWRGRRGKRGRRGHSRRP